MGAELVVGVFDEEGDAWDAVVAAAEVAAQRRSGILDACLVVRRQDGTVHIRETRDISPSAAGWSGAASGLLGGVILGFPIAGAAVAAGLAVHAARRHDIGITDEFERSVSDDLRPGRAAAVALVNPAIASQVEEAARRRGARTQRLTLDDPGA